MRLSWHAREELRVAFDSRAYLHCRNIADRDEMDSGRLEDENYLVTQESTRRSACFYSLRDGVVVATWGRAGRKLLGVEYTQHGHCILEVVADRVAEEVLTAYARFFAACTNIGFTDFDRLTVCGLGYFAAS